MPRSRLRSSKGINNRNRECPNIQSFVLRRQDRNVVYTAALYGCLIVAEKISIALAEPYLLTCRYDGNVETTMQHHCTASIGLVLFIDHEASQEDILKWADIAMYQAKVAGRNITRSLCVTSSDMP